MKNIGKILLTSSAAIMMTNFSNANNIPHSKNYIAFGIGQTFATKANIPHPTDYWIAKEGYNSYFKNAQSFLIDVGWILAHNMTISINYNRLPKLAYSKTQIDVGLSTPITAPNKLSRHFNLAHEMYAITVGYGYQLTKHITSKLFMGIGYGINTVLSSYTKNLEEPPSLITGKSKIEHFGLPVITNSPNFTGGIVFYTDATSPNLFFDLRFDYNKFKLNKILVANITSNNFNGEIEEYHYWTGKLKMFQAIIGTSVLFN